MEYAKRNARQLEPHYSKHVMAMTAEGLHEKSDIAAELAFRDSDIDRLKAKHMDALCALEFRAAKAEAERDAYQATADDHYSEAFKFKAECERLRKALCQAAIDLRAIGNDYPGSSCQVWCEEKAAAIDAAKERT